MTEQDIQNQIRAAVSPYCIIFRVNVGTGRTPDGRYFQTGVPPGFSDLFGVRRSDGRAVFIEVKKPGGGASPAQKNFIAQMKAAGAIAGVCYSAAAAVALVKEDI